MTYAGGATEVQDEGNGSRRVAKVLQSDGLGRLASVCEVTSATQLGNGGTPAACGQDIAATGFLTSYQYDGLGNLTGVTQNGLEFEELLLRRSLAFDQGNQSRIWDHNLRLRHDGGRRPLSARRPQAQSNRLGYGHHDILLRRPPPSYPENIQ